MRYAELIDGIIISCRLRASELKSYEEGDGAIRVCIIPQRNQIDSWLNQLPASGDRYETIARIVSGGNYVLNRGRSAPPLDTYAFSAMKIATLLRVLEIEQKYISKSTQDRSVCESNGFAPYPGAVCYEIYANHALVCLIIVSVAGADVADDSIVAKAATDAITRWCKDGEKNECGQPIYSCLAPWNKQ